MTLQEAKAKLMAQGWEGEPTNEALLTAGWEPGSIIADLPEPEVMISRDELKTDAARLVAEAKAAQLPAQIMGLITKFAGAAIKGGLLILALMLLATGCCQCKRAECKAEVVDLKRVKVCTPRPAAPASDLPRTFAQEPADVIRVPGPRDPASKSELYR